MKFLSRVKGANLKSSSALIRMNLYLNISMINSVIARRSFVFSQIGDSDLAFEWRLGTISPTKSSQIPLATAILYHFPGRRVMIAMYTFTDIVQGKATEVSRSPTIQ